MKPSVRSSCAFLFLALFAVAARAQSQADLSVTKTGPQVVCCGDNVSYTVTVQNAGPGTAASVTLTDTMASNALFVSGQQDSGTSFSCAYPGVGSNGTISCTLAAFAAGETAQFTFVFAIDNPAPGTQSVNTASVSSTTPDPDGSDNSASITTRTAWSEAAVTKTGPAEAGPDTDVSYTVTIMNLGPDTLNNVPLRDVGPSGMTFVSVTQETGPTFNCIENANTIDCSGGGIPAGGSATFTFVFHIPPATPPGTFFTNTAQLIEPSDDADEENNTASATTHTPFPPLADVVVSKTAPNTVGPGTDFDYTITVSNSGPDTADSVSLTDTLPGTLTFVGLAQNPGGVFTCTTPAIGAGGTISCSVPSMAAGTSVTVTITAHVPSDTPSGTVFTNTATGSTTTADATSENNSSGVSSVSSAVDLSVVKIKTGGPTVNAGGTVTYTITVTNAGPDTAVSPRLMDVIPPGTTFQGFSQDNGPGAICGTPSIGGTGSLECSWGALASTASAQFTVALAVGPNTASITNTADVGSDSFDTDPSNNSSTVVTAVTLQSNPGVVKSGPGAAVAGTDVSYTITVSNTGISDAANLVLTDAVPANTTLVSFAAAAGFSCSQPPAGGTGTITCSIANFPAGAQATFTLVVHVSPGATGTISNTANVNAATNDTDANNNTSTVNTTVSSNADVAVTKSGPATVSAGTNATYTVVVTNNGPSDASNVTLTDAVPPGSTLVSATQSSGPTFNCTTGATITCSIATLTPGSTASFTFVFAVPPAATGTLVNTANVSTATNDPAGSNNTSTVNTTIRSSADLSVTKNGPAALPAGTNATYTVVVTNNGPSDASNVTLTDSVPTGSTMVSATQDSGPAFNCSSPAPGATGTITCTIPTMTPGSTATFTFVFAVSPTSTGTVDNAATVTTSTTDPNAANNTATVSSGINPGATDLSITKTVNPGPVGFNAPVTYTITVTNNGPATAFGTTVTDVLPAGTTFQSATASQGSCTGTTTVTCNLGTLAPAASATVTLTVRLPNTPQTVSNTATVSAANADTNGANNSATAALAVTAEIPTLSEWGILLLAAALMIAAMMAMRASS